MNLVIPLDQFLLVIIMAILIMVTMEATKSEWRNRYSDVISKGIHTAFYWAVCVALLTTTIYFHNFFFPAQGGIYVAGIERAAESCTTELHQ